MPHWPLCFTSTRPAVVLADAGLTRRTEAAGRAETARVHGELWVCAAGSATRSCSLLAGSGMGGSPTGTSSVGVTMYCKAAVVGEAQGIVTARVMQRGRCPCCRKPHLAGCKTAGAAVAAPTRAAQHKTLKWKPWPVPLSSQLQQMAARSRQHQQPWQQPISQPAAGSAAAGQHSRLETAVPLQTLGQHSHDT